MDGSCSQVCICSPVICRIAWHGVRHMRGINRLQAVQLLGRALGTDVSTRLGCAGRGWARWHRACGPWLAAGTITGNMLAFWNALEDDGLQHIGAYVAQPYVGQRRGHTGWSRRLHRRGCRGCMQAPSM